MSQIVTITDGDLTASIRCHGAELCSLIGPSQQEMIWQAGPAWPRHAPILFPIVGKLVDDRLRHGDQDYVLTQHGFARDLPFTLQEQSPTCAHFCLTTSVTTMARYPFPFLLDVIFQIDGGILSISYRISNPGEASLPASIGAHPAFRWPLADGIAKSAHRLDFSAPETASIRRLSHGLLDPTPRPTPIRGTTLDLDEDLFATDALILDQLASHWVQFSAPGAEPVSVAWDGANALGIWSKLGGDFLCIEPWHGFASPVGFDKMFALKPGLLHIPAGETRTLSHAIALGEAAGQHLIARGR